MTGFWIQIGLQRKANFMSFSQCRLALMLQSLPLVLQTIKLEGFYHKTPVLEQFLISWAIPALTGVTHHPLH